MEIPTVTFSTSALRQGINQTGEASIFAGPGAAKSRMVRRLSEFNPFDYFAIVVGMFGTLNWLIALVKVPQLFVVISGVLSTLICFFSLLLLAQNRFMRRLNPQQRRIYLFHFFFNLIPAINILFHLTETPWELFTC